MRKIHGQSTLKYISSGKFIFATDVHRHMIYSKINYGKKIARNINIVQEKILFPGPVT